MVLMLAAIGVLANYFLRAAQDASIRLLRCGTIEDGGRGELLIGEKLLPLLDIGNT